jgi:hypothetical protein
MNLAQVIYKYSRKDKNDKRITWNESQQKASKIVNMVLTGSDVASAISVCVRILFFWNCYCYCLGRSNDIEVVYQKER